MAAKLGATLFALLFAIPFGAVGAFAAYGIGSMVSGSLRANDWILVQARVDQAALNASRGRKGGTTYYASGSYHYTLAGKHYVSDKLGFVPFGGSDNLGSWQEDMAAFLTEAKASGKTVPVYVNPDDPTESVVDPGIRWSMVLIMGVFGVLFGGVGVGALFAIGVTWFAGDGAPKDRRRSKKEVAAFIAKVNRKAARKQADLAPSGNAATIPSTSSSGLVGMWIFTIVWNLISFPMALVVIPQVTASGEWVGYLVLLFPLIGVLMLWGCINQAIGRVRRGKAALSLSDKAPRMGGRLAGVVHYRRGSAGKDFELRLVGTEHKRGDSNSSVPRWWRDTNARSIADPAGGIRIPFQFDIPSRVDVPGMEAGDEPYTLEWSIQVKGRGEYNPADTFDIILLRSLTPAKDLPKPDPTPEQRQNEAAIARLFGPGAAATLTPEQRATFSQLSPRTQTVAAWVVKTFNRRKP